MSLHSMGACRPGGLLSKGKHRQGKWHMLVKSPGDAPDRQFAFRVMLVRASKEDHVDGSVPAQVP